MRRMLGPMLEANVWANMKRMLRPMLVVRAAGYTMRQIAHIGSKHYSLHSNVGSILWSGTKKPTASRLPFNTNVGSWPFVIRASATRCVECFQCPTLEVFEASCSRGYTWYRPSSRYPAITITWYLVIPIPGIAHDVVPDDPVVHRYVYLIGRTMYP